MPTVQIGLSSPLKKTVFALRQLTTGSGCNVNSIVNLFHEVTEETDGILEQTASIIACVESDSISAVLPKVRILGEATSRFLQNRLEATAEILTTLRAEAPLLEELALLVRNQKRVASETGALSMLTSIEVARMGDMGAGFHYLAQELDEFSHSVAKDTQDLLRQTNSRVTSIHTTERELANSMPKLHSELASIETTLCASLAQVEAGLLRLAESPEQFRNGVIEIAQQINNAISAIQANDITRQQLEHVEQAFAQMSQNAEQLPEDADSSDAILQQIAAGLAIQHYQMQSAAETVGGWSAQVSACMAGILQVSTSDLGSIGPIVFEQEQMLNRQLDQVVSLERACMAFDQKIQSALSGLPDLMQLVNQHLARSESIRDRLQLLTFNSIIEAGHLGARVDGIRAISISIKELAEQWSIMTQQSRQTMQAIEQLVEHSQQVANRLSLDSQNVLRSAQEDARQSLRHLTSAASCAGTLTDQVKQRLETLRNKIHAAEASADQLEQCKQHMNEITGQISELKQEVESVFPEIHQRYDPREMEQLYASCYTTEMERTVLRAALNGEPLPAAEQSFAGNDVELF